MKHEEKAASFISKLYSILRSKQHAKAIVWDTQLKGIRVLNQKKLQETVLPRYFRHNKFSSFVRQLNMYDFHKIHLGDHKSIFCHAQFNPKNKQSIYNVKRKVAFNIENTEKSSSGGDKQISQKGKRSQKQLNPPRQANSLRSFASFNCFKNSQKDNIWSHRSSFKLFQSSIQGFEKKPEQQISCQSLISTQAMVNKIAQELLSLKIEGTKMKEKIQKMKRDHFYKKYFKRNNFMETLYQKLGLQFQEEKENLSELSIQGQLLFQTKKSLTMQHSLRLLESGPINYRDTIGYLMGL